MNIRIERPAPADIDAIHAVLTETYWSPGISRERVARACASACAIARDEQGELVGFARVVTDCATFAWLCDVFVLPAHTGQGVARGLVRALQCHSELEGLRRWLLATRDAHGVYAPLGFTALDGADRFMHIKAAAPYGRATA